MSERMRCGSCGKVVLNYPMIPGVIYESAQIQCSACSGISKSISKRLPHTLGVWYSGRETYGDHHDEWEDMKSGDAGGIGWHKAVSTSLFVIAHADDEVLIGASLARFASEGHQVHVLALADGETSRPGATSDDVLRRLKCFRAAEGVLGFTSRLHRWPVEVWLDQRLDTVPLLDITLAIESAIHDVKPSIVYTHSPGDLNADHRRVYEAVLPAVRPKSGVQAVYSFHGPVMTHFDPQVYVAVTEAHIQQQKAALDCYGDELAGEWRAMHARQIAWGHCVGEDYAEALEVVRLRL